jgi:hypothetical protein
MGTAILTIRLTEQVARNCTPSGKTDVGLSEEKALEVEMRSRRAGARCGSGRKKLHEDVASGVNAVAKIYPSPQYPLIGGFQADTSLERDKSKGKKTKLYFVF